MKSCPWRLVTTESPRTIGTANRKVGGGLEDFSLPVLLNYLPLLLSGLPGTIGIAFFAILCGVFIGFFAGLARVSLNPVIKHLAMIYVEVIRGVPLLVIIYLIYFGLGSFVDIPRYAAAVISLGIFSGAYVAEIFRAAVESVPSGQMEAAQSVGLTRGQALRKIILPQALKRMVPPLAGQFISLTKDSSLASVIAIPELTLTTYQAITMTFRSFQFWMATAFIYFVLGWVLQRVARHLERRFAVID